jgi:hypothetical protein
MLHYALGLQSFKSTAPIVMHSARFTPKITFTENVDQAAAIGSRAIDLPPPIEN